MSAWTAGTPTPTTTPLAQGQYAGFTADQVRWLGTLGADYGVIAVAGIAVNSAIVLIAAANERRVAGMSVQHAVIYAARRRVVPILITSTTTIGGLFSLAVGLGGKSLMWGPVAASIVWGLGFSTVLTLFAVPLLYRLVMVRSGKGWLRRREPAST